MSVELIYPFNTPGNYDYDSDRVEISGGKAKLKLIDLPNQDFNQPFDSDTGFTYDATKAEFTGGQVQQKSKRPANACFYASYLNGADASWGNGTLTAMLGGVASAHDGYLDLSGGNAYVEYNTDNFALMQGSAGCIRMRIAFTYSGASPSTQYLIQSSPSIASRVYLVHNSTFIQCYITNTVGTTIYSMTFSWTPSAGTIYEFEVNWTPTHAYFFINGTIQDSDTGSLGMAEPSLFRLGQNSGAKIKIYDIAVFTALQHSSNYTPNWSNFYEYDYLTSTVELPEMHYTGAGTLQEVTNFVTSQSGVPHFLIQIGQSGDYLYWNGSAWAVSDESYTQSNTAADFLAHVADLVIAGEVYGQLMIVFPDTNTQAAVADLTITVTGQTYSTSNDTVTFHVDFRTDGLESFTESATKPGSDEIKYTLAKDSTEYYWNGSAWAESDGTYDQSSTAAEINTNAASFTSLSTDVEIKMFLHSEDGTTYPEIDTVTVTYDHGGEPGDTLEYCNVYGYSYQEDGTPSQEAITVELSQEVATYKTSTIVQREIVTITPDVEGYWDVELIENANMESGAQYIFKINGKMYYVTVPNTLTRSFVSLL